MIMLVFFWVGRKGDRREQGHWMPDDGEICSDSQVPPYHVCTEDPLCFCFWEYDKQEECWFLDHLFCA